MLPFAAFLYKEMVQVVGGASPVSAVKGIPLLIELCQGRLDKGGGGAQESDDPHPEHGTCASRRDGRHHTHQIAHAYPAGGGHDKGLESGDPILIALFVAFQGHPQHLRKQPEGQETGADSKVKPCGDQDHHQQGEPQGVPSRKGDGDEVSPEDIVDCAKKFHDLIL